LAVSAASELVMTTTDPNAAAPVMNATLPARRGIPPLLN